MSEVAYKFEKIEDFIYLPSSVFLTPTLTFILPFKQHLMPE